MNIGFANIYSFRPHVEHLYYLSRLAQQAGHTASFLTCDASVSWCYARGLKGSSGWQECPKCMVGGIRSFPAGPVRSISRLSAPGYGQAPNQLTLSSACTLLRTETEADQLMQPVLDVRDRLSKPVQEVFDAASRWIVQDRLDALVCFNGRMELTQALTQAARVAGIPFLTHERTWFGNGLLLVPNDNCLGLSDNHRMAKQFRELPLTESQARLAASLVAKRFSRQNNLEWRVYNPEAQAVAWPAKGEGPRYLVLPSSRNEVVGHPDWSSGWGDQTQALDDLMAAQNLKPEQLVVRCHPNWAETIGKATGERPHHLYREWCRRRGVACIDPSDTASTSDLIAQADVIVLNGGSAAIEAGVLGKQILSLGPASYIHAGIAATALGPQDLASGIEWPNLTARERMRLTLRFIYMSARRLPQFNDHVQPVTTTRYRYFDGADPSRLDHALLKGSLMPDDPDHAANELGEDEVIDALENKAWGQLASYIPLQTQLPPLAIQRRHGMRWVDGVRGFFKHGDR